MTARATAILTVVLLAVSLAILGAIALAWTDCNRHSGRLVRGVIGYECVRTEP